MILAEAVWTKLLAQTTAQGRAQVMAAEFPTGGAVDFSDPVEGVVRTVTFGAWTVSVVGDAAFAIPGAFTDPATGAGEWFDAIWKDHAGVEVFRCTVGVGAGDWSLIAPMVAGVPVARGQFALKFGSGDSVMPVVVSGSPSLVQIRQGQSYSLAQFVSNGVPPYAYTVATGSLPAGIQVDPVTGNIVVSASAGVATTSDIVFRVADATDARPVCTTLPTISGELVEGEVLTATPGIWTKTPTGYAYAWLRNGVVITGESLASYTLTAADVGAYITVSVVASNASGSGSAATSATIGPVQAMAAGVVPDVTIAPTITGTAQVGRFLFVSTGTWDHSPTGYAYQWLRDGVEIADATSNFYLLAAADEAANISARVIATNDVGDSAPVLTAEAGPVAAAPVVTPGALPLFGLVSEVGGVDLPFSFAHGFKKADVPAGKTVGVASGLTQFQCVPISTWPDGSLRMAWISGHATLGAGVQMDVQLQVEDGAAPTPSVSLADLRAALPSGSIAITIPDPAVNVTINLPTLVAGQPFDIFGNGSGAVFTGPQCSSWVFRQRIAGTAHLELWVPIRCYANGAVEINVPWLQNGDLRTASPKHYPGVTATITLGGVQRYAATFEAKNKRIVPLVSGNPGTDRSYWQGTNPKIRPVHDTQYLRASRLVPNYRDVPPSESTLNGLLVAYTANSLGGIPFDETRPGIGPVGVLPRWNALHITSGADSRAFDHTLTVALCGSIRPVHYRDESTGRYLAFTQYPQACLDPQATPIIPVGTLSGSGSPSVDIAHQPSYGYYPWLITGDVLFLESQLAYATWNYVSTNWSYRKKEKAVVPTNRQERGVAWGFRTLAQLCAALPDSHVLRSEFYTALGHNVDYWASFMPGGGHRFEGYSGVNAIGFIQGTLTASLYGANVADVGYWTHSYTSPWQQSMQTQAMHQALKLEVAPDMAKAATVFAWSASRCIAVAGGNGSGWPYTRFGPYAFPTIYPKGGLDVEGGHFLATFADCWAAWSGDQAMFNPALPSEETNPAPGGVILDGSSVSKPMNAFSFAQESQTAIPLAALACAAEEGLPGAVQGWNNITGASNFTTADMNSYPMFAFEPRT